MTMNLTIIEFFVEIAPILNAKLKLKWTQLC